jgi:hypothetical protein
VFEEEEALKGAVLARGETCVSWSFSPAPAHFGHEIPGVDVVALAVDGHEVGGLEVAEFERAMLGIVDLRLHLLAPFRSFLPSSLYFVRSAHQDASGAVTAVPFRP